MSARIPETKRAFLSPGNMQVTSSVHKRDRSVPQQMFFVSAIRPKITTRCRDQSPLPLRRLPSLSAALHLSNPTHTTDGWKKKQEKREKKRILPRFSLVMSRPRVPLAPVYVSRSRCLNGLVSSRLYLSRGPLESPFLILLVVVLILAKCCDQHPPFVCPPPFVSTRPPSLALSNVFYQAMQMPRGSWILEGPIM